MSLFSHQQFIGRISVGFRIFGRLCLRYLASEDADKGVHLLGSAVLFDARNNLLPLFSVVLLDKEVRGRDQIQNCSPDAGRDCIKVLQQGGCLPTQEINPEPVVNGTNGMWLTSDIRCVCFDTVRCGKQEQ